MSEVTPGNERNRGRQKDRSGAKIHSVPTIKFRETRKLQRV